MGIKSNTLHHYVQKILTLSDIPIEELFKEIEDIQKDLEYYGSGIFLWMNDSYPNVVLLYSLVGIHFLSKLKILPKMKVVVDEYYTFIADVKAKYYNLFKEEMEESQKMVFY